jgi:hypothetical protein
VTLEGRTCAQGLDLSTALPVDLPSNGAVTVTLDVNAPCIVSADGTAGVYSVFALPPHEDEYLLAFSSSPQGAGLFSPLVRILDANGNITREIARDAFVFRGSSLSLGLRIRPGDAYLVALSDAGTVGESISQIRDGTFTTGTAVGTGFVYWSSGTSTTETLVYSHNGIVSVTTTYVPE